MCKPEACMRPANASLGLYPQALGLQMVLPLQHTNLYMQALGVYLQPLGLYMQALVLDVQALGL